MIHHFSKLYHFNNKNCRDLLLPLQTLLQLSAFCTQLKKNKRTEAKKKSLCSRLLNKIISGDGHKNIETKQRMAF